MPIPNQRWLISTIICIASLLIIGGCGPIGKGEVSAEPTLTPKANVSAWVIENTDIHAATPALLWNGLIGIRVGADGRTNGQEGFSILSYQATRRENPDPKGSALNFPLSGEEKILPVSPPLMVDIRIDGQPLRPSGNYLETLDMKTGLLTVAYDCGSSHVRVEYAMDLLTWRVSSRWTITRAHQVQIIPSKPNNSNGLTEVDHLESETQKSEWANTIAHHQYDVSPKDGQAVVFQQFASLRSKIPVAPPQFGDFAKSVAEEWAKRWQTDIEIEGPVEDQQRIHALLFYLRSAIHPGGQMSISPFALSNSQYFGHVFWDADIWVLPALAMIQPDSARQIAEYRLRMFSQAKRNFDEWVVQGRPISAQGPDSKRVWAQTTPSRGAKYPWESSVSGYETVPGPSKYEDHITGSVLWGLDQAANFGLVPGERVGPTAAAAAQFAMARSEKGANGLEVKGTMSPDENHIGNNDLYTNLLFEWLQNGRQWMTDDEIRKSGRTPYAKPHDDKTLLTYDNDALRGYKQAAAVLSIYPLQYPPAEKQARAMMDRFADKVIKNGPAMTDSVHATIWARLGEPERAYVLWNRELDDFLKPPLLLFSEKRAKPITYFTTGAGGSLQTVLYGFLGFRLDSMIESGAAWSVSLSDRTSPDQAGLNRWLSVKPNLPLAWKSVKFRHFTVRGKQYDLVVTHEKVSVTAVAAH